MTNENKSGFYGLGIAPKLLEMLHRNNFTEPTPIQSKTIPVAIEGKDIVGIAQTGTGKTLSFSLPMMQNIARLQGSGLVLVPTRELAMQVNEEIMKFGRPLGLRTALVVGGAPMGRQIRDLKNRPHIVIATPGRLIDHLDRKRDLFQSLKVLVLDEADRMLDMGFEPQIKRILENVPTDRQTMLFSATMPHSIMSLAHGYMKLPLRIEISPPGTTVKEIDQEVIFLKNTDKFPMLCKILERHRGSILIFTRTKRGAKKLVSAIHSIRETVAELHSNRSLAQRKEAINGFKNGNFRILVATDIAARGIDVKDIEVVVNFDLPSTADDYVHRIGRTARAGKKGRAITFAMPDEGGEVKQIERLIRTTLPIGKESSATPVFSGSAQQKKQRGNFRGRSFGGGRRGFSRDRRYRGRR